MSSLDVIDLATVEESVFRAHLDSEFQLHGGGWKEPVTLVAVTEYPERGGESALPTRRPFGLVFSCAGAALPQGIYALSHPELPSCALFLSPFEGGGDWCTLEAILN